MWEGAPLNGLIERIHKIFKDSVRDNVVHIRPVYMRFLNGLPRDVVERLHDLVQSLNRRSDERVREWAQHLSVGSQHGMGKRAFKQAQKFIDEMYGTDTGEQLERGGKLLSVEETEQVRQDELGFMMWMNDQYDKAAAFVRGLIIRHTGEVFVNTKEEAEHVAKALEGGLYHEIAWELLDIASERGIFLKAKDWFPSHDEFLEHFAHYGIEDKFEERCRHLLGEREFRVVVREKLLFLAMKEARDPKYATAA
jgi:hypothetical protein